MNDNDLFCVDELHLPIIFLDILKNAWLAILAAAVACIGVFTYATTMHQPVYTTDATFVVSPRSNSSYVGFYDSLSTANKMAGVFEEVFSSDMLARLIREDLGNSELSFSVNATVAEGTNILCVTVQSNSPETAHMVIQSVLRNYRRVSGYLFGNIVLDVLKKPQISVVPSNPYNMQHFMTIGAMLAVVLMLGLVALFSVMRPTVKTLSCAKRRLEDDLLGVLPKEKNSRLFRRQVKKAPLITDAGTSFRYTESLLQLAHRVRHEMQKNGKKILLVTSVAENEGKSTISANLALALSKHGHKVAHVDMDLRKPAVYKIFESFPKEDLMTCLQQDAPAFLDNHNRLHILSSSNPLPRPDKLLHSKKLAELIDTLREEKDFVILDSSPYTSTADTGMLLQYADCCLMVIRQDWAPFRICQDVAEDIGASNAEYLGYVINQYIDNDQGQDLLKPYGKYGYHRYNRSY